MAVGASKFRVSHSDVSKYKSQIAKLRVAAKCGCGCPIIDFALGSERKLGASEIVAEAGGNLPKVSLWALFSMLVRVNCGARSLFHARIGNFFQPASPGLSGTPRVTVSCRDIPVSFVGTEKGERKAHTGEHA